MIPVLLQHTDNDGWVLLCEVLDRSLPLTRDTDILEAARLFGWAACECGLTDGTTACSHKTPELMLEQAQQFLVTNRGLEADMLHSPYWSSRLEDIL
ncbi:MAG: hypothetical protein VB861_16785 [Planctomycetaceae bacterium]